MGFVEAIEHVFNNYANFSGRARRSEFWYFMLFTMGVEGILTILETAAGDGALGTLFGAVSGLFALGVLIPELAVAWRRLHDIGRSGGFYFIGLIPIVGWILLLVWYSTDSQPGENEYGLNPKEEELI